MSLDACVYCNCFESGKLLHEPPRADFVTIGPDGSRCYALDDSYASYMEFDNWNRNACPHADGELVYYRIGNIALVGILRDELSRYPSDFPILLSKFLYNGIHGGDWIPVSDFPALRLEAMKLSEISSSKRENQQWLDGFRMQLRNLINAAIQVNKPIVF